MQQLRQRVMFFVIVVTLATTASVALATGSPERPILAAAGSESGQVVGFAPARPAPVLAQPGSGLGPVPTIDDAPDPVAQRAWSGISLVGRLDVQDGYDSPPAPVAAAAAAPVSASTSSESSDPGAEADDELATTETAVAPVGPAPDDDVVDVEHSLSHIPDPPDVGASDTRETFEVVQNTDENDPWLGVRRCESHNTYDINTGNGFYGAYQFTISTWDWVAGKIGRSDLIGVRPDLASPADQDRMAQALAFEVQGGGLHHWPVCGRHYG